jgi:rSAM/selenodomain-associated transferase 2
MTISVIIPTLNEEKTTTAALIQTAALGFEELIVVDGGSSDGTAEIVASHMHSPQSSALSPIRFVPAPRGRARQMNEGVKASRGEILLFLHADTRLPSTAKQDIEAAMQNSQVVGGRFDVAFDRQTCWSAVISAMMNWRSRWSGIATGDQAFFVRRQVFEQLGGFTEIPLMEDIDFSRRLKRMGRTAPLRSRVVTSYRRWETNGPIRTILLMWTLRFLYWTGVSPQRLAHLYTTVR